MTKTTFVNIDLNKLDEFARTDDTHLLQTLETQAEKHDLRYLLAYHDDGLVWGHYTTDKQWSFSSGKFQTKTTNGQNHNISPPFRVLTLQECRAFGPTAELLIWREQGILNASLLTESDGNTYECFTQTQLLWGDTVEDKKDGFTLLRESSQGLRHAVPCDLSGKKGNLLKPRASLTVAHYIDYDDNNQAYVKWSRLQSVNGG